jgi:hypothetical protein
MSHAVVTALLAAFLAAAGGAWAWRDRARARSAVGCLTDGAALAALALLTSRWLLGPLPETTLGARLLVGVATFAALTLLRHCLGSAFASRRIALAAGAVVAVNPAFLRLAHLGLAPLAATALGFAAAAYGLAFARTRGRADLAVATAAGALCAHLHAGPGPAALALVAGVVVWWSTARPSPGVVAAAQVLGGAAVVGYLVAALRPALQWPDPGGAGAEGWARLLLLARGESVLYPLLLVAGLVELAARRANALFVAASGAVLALAGLLGGPPAGAPALVREAAPLLPALLLLVGVGVARLDAWLAALRLPAAPAHAALVALALHWQWLVEEVTWTP